MQESERHLIEKQTFSEERALYNINYTNIIDCRFEGEEDGESALKEGKDLIVKNCFFDLRYPLWHDNGLQLFSVEASVNCRAMLWYTKNLIIDNSKLLGIKAIRECENITVRHSKIISDECFWKSNSINVNDSEIEGEYCFLECKDVKLENVTIKGKYTMQYMEDCKISNSVLDTKDAFWHSKNVTVKDSIVKGEYLGWYSDGLTLINCKIISHQPLVDCKNLTLVNCTMEDCDLAFEYSEVNADIKGSIKSIKNPKDGIITVDDVEEIILEGAAIPCKGKVVIRKKGE